jgi:hypothetical protein
LTDATLSTENFIANHAALIQDFSNYLQDKHNHGKMQFGITGTTGQEQYQHQPTALINHLTDFLNCQGILTALMTALELDNMHDLWIVDSVTTYYMSNKLMNFSSLEKFAYLVFVLVVNRKGSPVKGSEKIKIVSEIMCNVLYVPSFPFQLLSVSKISSTFNCDVIFTHHKVIFTGDCWQINLLDNH